MQLNYKTGLFILGFIMLSFTVSSPKEDFTRVKDEQKLKDKIIEKAKNTHSIRSDFRQEKHLTMFEEVMKSKGEFLFKEPNKVRWEYVEPISYIIVLDGKKVSIKDDEKVKSYDMDSNPIFKEINRLLVHSLNGEILSSKDFRIEYYESKNRYMARLFPNSEEMKQLIENIEIFFAKIDFGVVGLRINEFSKDFTIIKFQNRILNEDIENASFNLNL
jgi:outer membrane lipoprotein-sorting protein